MMPAQAQQSFNNLKTAFDQNYCSRKVFVKADSDLNVIYRKLMAKLGPKGKSLLLTSQRHWIAERDRECQDGNITDLDCITDKTVARANFLNDRLRECLSSGCLITNLDQ